MQIETKSIRIRMSQTVLRVSCRHVLEIESSDEWQMFKYKTHTGILHISVIGFSVKAEREKNKDGGARYILAYALTHAFL